MTQEDKELLFKDLCARLPYEVIVKYKSREKEGNVKITCGNIGYVTELGNGWWKECKPYLRPMSSMTEEEIKTYQSLQDIACSYHYEFGDIVDDFLYFDNDGSLDYLNSIHIDYRDLIQMGLAIAVTKENNPYKD